MISFFEIFITPTNSAELLEYILFEKKKFFLVLKITFSLERKSFVSLNLYLSLYLVSIRHVKSLLEKTSFFKVSNLIRTSEYNITTSSSFENLIFFKE